MADDPREEKSQSPQTSRSIARILIAIARIVIGAILIGLVWGVLGLIVGATIGGNMGSEFRFAGMPGYEGGGALGALIGLVIGTLGGALTLACLRRKNKSA